VPTFVVLADVRGGGIQNPQDLGSLWGELRTEIEEHGGTPGESYVVAGEYDILLTYEAEDVETAIEVSIAVERQGIETQTLPVLPIDRLGDLVEDVRPVSRGAVRAGADRLQATFDAPDSRRRASTTLTVAPRRRTRAAK